MTKLSPDLEALMPEPFATMHDDGYWSMEPGTEPYESRYVGWRQEVFTADQVRAAMLAATERAAKLAAGLAYDAAIKYADGRYEVDFGKEVGDAIRGAGGVA